MVNLFRNWRNQFLCDMDDIRVNAVTLFTFSVALWPNSHLTRIPGMSMNKTIQDIPWEDSKNKVQHTWQSGVSGPAINNGGLPDRAVGKYLTSDPEINDATSIENRMEAIWVSKPDNVPQSGHVFAGNECEGYQGPPGGRRATENSCGDQSEYQQVPQVNVPIPRINVMQPNLPPGVAVANHPYERQGSGCSTASDLYSPSGAGLVPTQPSSLPTHNSLLDVEHHPLQRSRSDSQPRSIPQIQQMFYDIMNEKVVGKDPREIQRKAQDLLLNYSLSKDELPAEMQHGFDIIQNLAYPRLEPCPPNMCTEEIQNDTNKDIEGHNRNLVNTTPAKQEPREESYVDADVPAFEVLVGEATSNTEQNLVHGQLCTDGSDAVGASHIPAHRNMVTPARCSVPDNVRYVYKSKSANMPSADRSFPMSSSSSSTGDSEEPCVPRGTEGPEGIIFSGSNAEYIDIMNTKKSKNLSALFG